MNTKNGMLACMVLMTLPALANADINLIAVNKIGKNLYQSSDGKFIQTESCYEDAKNVQAVLVYEKYACHNTIRFGSDKYCDVQNVYSESKKIRLTPLPGSRRQKMAFSGYRGYRDAFHTTAEIVMFFRMLPFQAGPGEKAVIWRPRPKAGKACRGLPSYKAQLAVTAPRLNAAERRSRSRH